MNTLKLFFSNNSGYTENEVSVLFYGTGLFNVKNIASGSDISNSTWCKLTDLKSGVEITNFSGRVYICYGETFPFSGPQAQTPTADSFFDRYDKMEMTFNGAPADVADLTSIDFWSIPMELTTSKNGVQVQVVKGLYSGVTARDVYDKLAPLSTPPKSGLTGAIPALVPGEFQQTGSGPNPKHTFGRIIGPSVYPPSTGLPASPYDTLESYLAWLNTTFGDGVIAKIKGEFAGVGPTVPATGPQSKQAYDLTAKIDKDLNITLNGTVGSGTINTTMKYKKDDLLNPTGIYGGNPPVSINGASPKTLGNNVYSWITGDLMAGINIGALGSSVKVKGTDIGSMDSSDWFFGNLPSKYMFSGAQPNESGNYNPYAATLHQLSAAYPFAYAERFTPVFASLNPANVDSLNIELVPAVLPPEYLVDSKQPWQDTGIKVKENFTITYQSGLWTANPADNNGQLYDANGNPSFIDTPSGYAMPGEDMGMLVGRVNGKVFAIGNSGVVPKGLSGNLELCINDDLHGEHGAGLTDNHGSIRVLVQPPA